MQALEVELLLPAGNEECLRAAVNNGADAVYFGLSRFNARRSAGNFTEDSVFGAVDYCHKRNAKAYMALNILVKNSEIADYFGAINAAYSAKADAIIIQDPCFIPIIKRNFHGLKIHLSTQATTTNSYSIPDGIERAVLSRELPISEIAQISRSAKTLKNCETEVFVHGALCFSYSGQCLFSSIAGGRSGNRGLCAQPCRMEYNNKYALSTMDLCLLEKIPELICAGVASFKVEGRMRSPLYVATAARIYRKYIDAYYAGKFKAGDAADKKDIDELKLAFNREFTTGFGFCDNVLDSGKPMNRGIFLGTLQKGKLKLRETIKRGDGIAIWIGKKTAGYALDKIVKSSAILPEAASEAVFEAHGGDVVEIASKGAPDGSPVYKTSSADMKFELGDAIKPIDANLKKRDIVLPRFGSVENRGAVKIFAKAYSKKSAVALDNAKADAIYYDLLKEDCAEVKNQVTHAKFFVYAPRILSDRQVVEIAEKIKLIKPDGVLIGNRGLLSVLLNADAKQTPQIHLDYSFNCFNDIDLQDLQTPLGACFGSHEAPIPIISPELNFQEIRALKNKVFIALVHGDVVLMNSRQKLKAPELVDGSGRHFHVRNNNGITEILNSKQLGLFNKALEYLHAGVKYFYIDTEKDADKFVRIYRKILSGEKFGDGKIRKGYTTGHFGRGVA